MKIRFRDIELLNLNSYITQKKGFMTPISVVEVVIVVVVLVAVVVAAAAAAAIFGSTDHGTQTIISQPLISTWSLLSQQQQQ